MTSQPGSSDDKFQEPIKSTEDLASWRSLFIVISDLKKRKKREYDLANNDKEFSATPEEMNTYWKM